jgi:hypothetical protein
MLREIQHLQERSGVKPSCFFFGFSLGETQIFGDGNFRAKMVTVTYRLKTIVAVAYLVLLAYPARSAQTTNKKCFTAGNLCNMSGRD